jgi:hypothetical protein
MIEFVPFPKIARFKRDIVVTEKLDGTNAQIHFTDYGDLYVGSRNRWITPGKDTDNYGFAGWVHENRAELEKLGPGSHFGEWWGAGIARRYGLNEKRFSLFNTHRWADDAVRPSCCHVVPILYQGIMNSATVQACIQQLETLGSVAARGFMDLEGIIVFHTASSTMYKQTVKNDEKHKGEL